MHYELVHMYKLAYVFPAIVNMTYIHVYIRKYIQLGNDVRILCSSNYECPHTHFHYNYDKINLYLNCTFLYIFAHT